MARRAFAPPTTSPVLTVDQKRRRIERLQNCIRDLEAFDPQQVHKRYGIPEVAALQAAIDEALAAAFGHGTPAYDRYSAAATLDNGPHNMRIEPAWGRSGSFNYDVQDAREARTYLAEGKQNSIVLLRQAIRTLEDEIADQEQHEPAVLTHAPARVASGRKVFVVHGHDDAARLAVARFLEQLGLEAIILSEQPDQAEQLSRNSRSAPPM